jgi:hypothetical protein
VAVELQVVALYPEVIEALAGRHGVRARKRKDKVWTQVGCLVAQENGKHLARPIHPIPDGSGTPLFRFQLIHRRSKGTPSEIAVPLQPGADSKTKDPEQRILAPIYNSAEKLVFEFERAEIFHLDESGHVELRFVGVHRLSGAVGTRTMYRFHSGYAALAARCSGSLSGATELFPAPEPHERVSKVPPVPEGEANLAFGVGRATAPERRAGEAATWTSDGNRAAGRAVTIAG